MLRGVIFDFDGVLVDSESAHLAAFRTILGGEVEGEVTQAEYDENYLGFDDHACFRRAFELRGRTLSPAAISDLVSRKWRIYAESLPSIPFFPGAVDLVRTLHAAAVPLVIASGSHRKEIETILQARDLRSCFRGIVSADDVSNFKPHPEPYLRGLDWLGVSGSPLGVVAIEDSTTGMASARAAGLRVIGVTTSHPKEKLGLAHHIIDSLTGISVEDLATLAVPA